MANSHYGVFLVTNSWHELTRTFRSCRKEVADFSMTSRGSHELVARKWPSRHDETVSRARQARDKSCCVGVGALQIAQRHDATRHDTTGIGQSDRKRLQVATNSRGSYKLVTRSLWLVSDVARKSSATSHRRRAEVRGLISCTAFLLVLSDSSVIMYMCICIFIFGHV